MRRVFSAQRTAGSVQRGKSAGPSSAQQVCLRSCFMRISASRFTIHTCEEDRSGTGPLNVFTIREATDQLEILRAIAISDLHNLVFQADYRIIPAVMRNS